MRILDPEEVQLGCWCFICCELDLHEIATQQELDAIRDDMRDVDWPTPLYVFRTRSEALEAAMRGVLYD